MKKSLNEIFVAIMLVYVLTIVFSFSANAQDFKIIAGADLNFKDDMTTLGTRVGYIDDQTNIGGYVAYKA